MPTACAKPFARANTSLSEHLRSMDRSAAAACRSSVTMPRRSARCSVHLSSLSRAGATIIKRRPEPFSDSSSAALCAKRLSDATEVRSCSAYPAVDDPARACGLGRALEGGETRAQPAASFFLASLGVRIVVDLDRLKGRDW